MKTSKHITGCEALNRAIGLNGGITSFSRLLGLSSRAVAHQWRMTRVPAEHCLSVEELTHGAVSCEMLRPDVKWYVILNRSK